MTLEFTSKERDAETGLDYFEARYLSSAQGRFSSPDPVGGDLTNPQSLNRYSYGLKNPLRFTDPTGLYVCKDSSDCSSDQDKAFEKSFDALRNSKNADVARAAAAYGTANKDNGVTVGFGDLSSQKKDGTALSTLGVDANGALRANSEVTIGTGLSGTTLTETIGHEGSHVADAQSVVASGLTPLGDKIYSGQNITPYTSEQRAYGVSNAILNSANESRPFACGSSNCTLGRGVFPGQVPGIVDNILRSNPIYNRNGKPMTTNNPGTSVVNGVAGQLPPKATVPR